VIVNPARKSPNAMLNEPADGFGIVSSSSTGKPNSVDGWPCTMLVCQTHRPNESLIVDTSAAVRRDIKKHALLR
jgi:hypothetical protein